MRNRNSYKDFIQRFKLLISKNPQLIITTLSNIFTMRLIGNKTHGDLAEIAISEFINQYMYDFSSTHVGKDLFRAKSKEEDITVINDLTEERISISLKAYGDGPLQLSTDKSFKIYPRISEEKRDVIDDNTSIQAIFNDKVFSDYSEINVLPLIYKEEEKKCNILIFDFEKAKNNTYRIEKVSEGKGRKHPIFRFLDSNGNYICEVRYGDKMANALQRGFWTHTKNASRYFESITQGWIDYSHNNILIKLFSHALVSSSQGHERAFEEIRKDIQSIKQGQKNEYS
ncbi:MAG: hypothetical protein AAF442_09540 [Pseudomonadota bacterium]